MIDQGSYNGVILSVEVLLYLPCLPNASSAFFTCRFLIAGAHHNPFRHCVGTVVLTICNSPWKKLIGKWYHV